MFSHKKPSKSTIPMGERCRHDVVGDTWGGRAGGRAGNTGGGYGHAGSVNLAKVQPCTPYGGWGAPVEYSNYCNGSVIREAYEGQQIFGCYYLYIFLMTAPPLTQNRRFFLLVLTFLQPNKFRCTNTLIRPWDCTSHPDTRAFLVLVLVFQISVGVRYRAP